MLHLRRCGTFVSEREIGMVEQDFDADPEADAVQSADEVGERAEAAGEVRQVAQRLLDDHAMPAAEAATFGVAFKVLDGLESVRVLVGRVAEAGAGLATRGAESAAEVV